MTDDAESAVVVIDDQGHRTIGLIIGYHYGYALVKYTDDFGIEHQEYLTHDDYELLEEWTKE